MINKIIFLISSPLYKRDYERYGAEIFIKNGFEVLFYNICPIIHTELYKYATRHNIYKGDKEIIFYKKRKIINQIKLLNNAFIISLVHYSYTIARIYKAISGANIPYALSVLNCVPTRQFIRPLINNNINRYKINNLSRIPNIIRNRLFQPKFAKYFGIKGPTYILAGGKESILHPQAQIAMKNSKILWLHTFDYDIYLKNNSKNSKIDNQIALFIDAPSPRFKHDAHIKGIDSPLTEDKYYPSLCRFFDRIEKEFNIEVVISAHPKTDHDEYPSYFGGRKTVYGKTPEMIRSSKFIINRNSTSVNFAVLYNKPVIFHTSSELETNSVMSNQVHFMASWLGKVPINIDLSLDLDWNDELSIDSNTYLNYKEFFIKTSSSSNEFLWETVSNRIKDL